MRVICSWCENEGRPALVREKAPLSDNRDTLRRTDEYVTLQPAASLGCESGQERSV